MKVKEKPSNANTATKSFFIQLTLIDTSNTTILIAIKVNFTVKYAEKTIRHR